jgi:glucuronoarabinoxylan endo-1,4-beta-xylanase
MKNIGLIITNKLILISLLMLIVFCTLSTNNYAQDAAIINLDSTYQIIRGFGAANILQWGWSDMTDSEIETAFGTEDGQLGFSILRLCIQAQSDQWSENVPTAKKAHEMGVTIIAAPWNPPDEMIETIGSNTRLYHDMYEDYAYHLDDFAYYMEDNGVPIYGVSVQNEPDYGDWIDWTPDEMLTFMRDYADIIIETKVMAPETGNFKRSYSDPILNDSLACANLDIVCGHIYGGGLTPYPLAESKGKEVWMTEYLINSGDPPTDPSIDTGWPGAMATAQSINNCMHANMNTYVWWRIVRYYGPISDGTNNSGNKGDVTKKGYVMSQFSRFIRPGYYRIQCEKHPQSHIYTSAYIDSISSKVVIVAINTASEAKNQTFAFENGTVEKFTPYVTSETKNCSQESDILVSDDSLKTTLDGQSVTTFVSSGDVILAVDNSSSSPATFELFQNYPNPFNPTTRIEFEIPEEAFVSLKIYNLLGEEVSEIIRKDYPSGKHFVVFNASYLVNGIYFYTLRANDLISSKKMMIIK